MDRHEDPSGAELEQPGRHQDGRARSEAPPSCIGSQPIAELGVPFPRPVVDTAHADRLTGGRVDLAIITRPVHALCWWAQRGEGAFRSTADAPLDRSVRLAVSGRRTLAGARVGVFAQPTSKARTLLTERASWIEDESCIVGALVEGRLDVFVDDGGRPWDQAPATLIVEEAGGSFFDTEGGQRIDLGWVAYTNGRLDGELRALLLP